jgi:hypothetical protein
MDGLPPELLALLLAVYPVCGAPYDPGYSRCEFCEDDDSAPCVCSGEPDGGERA